jgi:hypothetical protein
MHNVLDAGARSFNKGIVTAYKIAGFVLLSVILFGMFAYLSVSGFFLFSTRWAVPSILTPNNDKVVQAQLAWLGQRHELERLEGELVSYEHDLQVAKLASQTWGDFGSAYETALGRETKHSRAKLAAVQDMMDAISTTSPATPDAGLSLAEIDRQLANGMIDLEEHARLRAAAKDAAVTDAQRRQMAVELQEKAQGLRGLLANGAGLDVDTLMRRRPLLESKLEAASQGSRETMLKDQIAQMSTLVASYRDTVERMRQNPYVRAADGELEVAFVPYANLANASDGAPVYDCALTFLFCSRIGTVKGVVGGEVVGDHPVSSRDIRGRMVEMTLDRPDHAEARSLVLGRPPFFF